MTEIIVDVSNEVRVERVRLSLKCRTCSHEWAVFLTSTGKMPFGGDTCGQCDKAKRMNSVEIHDGNKIEY